MEADSHALFRSDALRLMRGRKKEALDEIGFMQLSCTVKPSLAEQNPS
jgi:hypothetical protein